MRKKSEALETLKHSTELKELVRKHKEEEAITKSDIPKEILERDASLDKIRQNLTPEGFKEEVIKANEHFEDVVTAAVNDEIRGELSVTQTGIIFYYGTGKSITEISKQLGISRQTIYNYLQTEKVKNGIIKMRKEVFEASLIRLKYLNIRAVKVLEQGLSSYPEKYNIAKFVANASLRLLEVEKNRVELIEEKKSQDKETGEEQKKTVSISAEKTKRNG